MPQAKKAAPKTKAKAPAKKLPGGATATHSPKPKDKFYSSCNSKDGCSSPGSPKPGQEIVNE